MSVPPARPALRPADPRFSSGPCVKRPGWTPAALDGALLGRSHRAPAGKAKLAAVIEESRALLGIPEDHRVAIMAASDTGAFEAAMWSLLGPRGVDVFAWEAFGKGWAKDIVEQLGLADVRVVEADYGSLPDLSLADPARDTVFTWNGTTSGVRVPDASWIAPGRDGLTLCDATSAAFAMNLPWAKLDVTTWSWQKVLGGEAQHGMLVLSPRAMARLESHTPSWPVPKIFRLAEKRRPLAGVFRGETINTPSMLAVEDQLDALAWARDVGGLKSLIARAEANLALIADWVARTEWVDFLAADPRTRSCTSVCLKIADAWFQALDHDAQAAAAKAVAVLLDDEGAAHDVASHPAAPPGLRVWAGATVEAENLGALLPWLDWAFATVKAEHACNA